MDDLSAGVGNLFHDYANTLFVGSTMRPLTDQLRVSREKLAYLVDSISAPVANLALISTWTSGVQLGPYWAFLMSIPCRLYPIFALVFIFWLIWFRRDFGAMYHAEVRARTTGKVLAESASPLSDCQLPHS